MTRTVARLLAESLEAHDVDQIFCVPGESYVGLTSAVLQRNSIRMIVCRHEGGAGYMAVADGRLRSRAGCCIVSRGPGLSNAMVSLHSAYPRRDADGDAGRPGRAQGFRPPGVAGAELFAAAVRRHQAGDRGERAGAGLGSDRARLPHRRKRHAGPGRGDPAGGHLRRNHRRRTEPAAAARGGRAACRRISTGWRTCWRRPNGRWCWWAARCWPTRCTTTRSSAICAAWPRNGCCRSARRIAGRNCSTRAIRTTAATWASACRPTLITEMKRADLMVALGERLTDTRQPVLQLSRRAAAATAAGPCLAGCQRGRPRVAPRSGHRRRSARGGARRCWRAAHPAGAAKRRAGSTGCTRSIASCWRRPGSRPPTASTSPPSSARSTSIWRPTRRSPRTPAISARSFIAISASSRDRCSCRRSSARWAPACRWRWRRRCAGRARRWSRSWATAAR